MNRVTWILGLRGLGAFVLLQVILGVLLWLMGFLDGSAPTMTTVPGFLAMLSPLTATLSMLLLTRAASERGELLVLPLTGRHPAAWSAACSLGLGVALVALVGLRESSGPGTRADGVRVGVVEGVPWLVDEEAGSVVRLGDAPGWRAGGVLKVGVDPGVPPLLPARLAPVGPGSSLRALWQGAGGPAVQAWSLAAAVTPLFALLCGALSSVWIVSRGRDAWLGPMLAVSLGWGTWVTMVSLAARGGLSQHALPGIMVLGLLGALSAGWSATRPR